MFHWLNHFNFRIRSERAMAGVLAVFLLLALVCAGLFSCAEQAHAAPSDIVVFIPVGEDGELDWSVMDNAPVPPELDITSLRPATQHYVNLLKQFPSIQFSTTFAHKSNYRFDWAKQSVGRVYGAYIWTDLFNQRVHIRLLIMDPPPLLNECRGFQLDSNFRNQDQTVADWDRCYLNFYWLWRGRPEADMFWQMQQDRLNELIWRDALRKVNLKSADVQTALKALGLESDGMPPYTSRYYNLFDETELDYQMAANRIMNEQLGLTLDAPVPTEFEYFDVTGLSLDALNAMTSEATFDMSRVHTDSFGSLEDVGSTLPAHGFWYQYDRYAMTTVTVLGLLVMAVVAVAVRRTVLA